MLQFRNQLQEILKEVRKVIIGQDEILESLLMAMFSRGHVLIEGAPGLAKTTIVNLFSQILQCPFKRIQFTTDLLPSDIIGINTYNEKTGFHVEKGPIFTSLLLADEINRASPKVQSALLEAMEEKQVTIGNETFRLPEPFFVFATQNPLDSMSTYELPQAQLDRFLFKLIIKYPDLDAEFDIADSVLKGNFKRMKPLLTPKDIVELQNYIQYVHMDEKLKAYCVQLVDATRNPGNYKIRYKRYIDYGSGPRGTFNLIRAAKTRAALSGRDYVIDEDIDKVAHPVLRHRVILNFEADAKKITTTDVIDELLKKCVIP
ncbi:MAG: AAA family ATPase [Candidatus Woesearchaeota archaeon]